ncbi:hypothetical protein LCGC14_0545780 [marine sediment metagenome]|uniref:Uncharacterized protein n=1 Tax=marine sediment metagenome TaxID=412755 RepID=A0A0F9UZH9_9ZZZZ
MTLVELLTVILVFAGFGFLIWSRLVQRNHPIVTKVKEWMSKPKEKPVIIDSNKWQQPNIEKKIY